MESRHSEIKKEVKTNMQVDTNEIFKDLWPSIFDEIPPHSLSLFSQTNSYFYSLSHLNKFKLAIANNNVTQQEIILVFLCINYNLLLKSEPLLSDWHKALNQYNTKAQTSCAILATTLKILLDDKLSQDALQQLQFLLLQSESFLGQLGISAIALIAQAKKNDSLFEKAKSKHAIKNIYNVHHGISINPSLGLFIIAPFFTDYVKPDVFKLVLHNNPFAPRTYFNAINTILHVIPTDHPFFIGIEKNLFFLLETIFQKHLFTPELFHCLHTLMKKIPAEALDGYLDARKSMFDEDDWPGEVFSQVKEIIELTSDAERNDWLSAKTKPVKNLLHFEVYFIAKVLSDLSDNKNLKDAINYFLSHLNNQAIHGRLIELFISLLKIKPLSPDICFDLINKVYFADNCLSPDGGTSLFEEILENYSHIFDANQIELGEFIEKSIATVKKYLHYPGNERMVLLNLCFQLRSPELIEKYLTVFKQEVEQSGPITRHNFIFLECCAALTDINLNKEMFTWCLDKLYAADSLFLFQNMGIWLAKLTDAKDIKKWLDKLFTGVPPTHSFDLYLTCKIRLLKMYNDQDEMKIIYARNLEGSLYSRGKELDPHIFSLLKQTFPY